MSSKKENKPEEILEEDMTVDLELEDGTNVTCAIITILEVNEKDYIVLLPLNNDQEEEPEDGEVWFYRYLEDENDLGKEPELSFIDDDDEYEMVADAFDEFLDSQEFEELTTEE